MRKKIIVLGMIVLCLVGLAGCAKKPEERLEAEQEIVSEDRMQSHTYVEKTDTGYYYYSWDDGGVRYADTATGNDLFLCNKPECKHDGNEFCVATNGKYRISTFCIYSGKIFVAAIEETDTQYLYKLLTVSLDGSEVQEFATYLTVEKSNQQAIGSYWAAERLLIHRNKVVLPIEWLGAEGLTDTNYHGTAILDLETKEVVYLDETPIAKENGYIFNACTQGDYLYYCKLEKKKTWLHRYHLTEKTDEAYSLSTGFAGNYAVLDDDTVVYCTRSGTSLYVYYPTMGHKEEKVKLVRDKRKYYEQIGQWEEGEESWSAGKIIFDGEYLYVPEDRKVVDVLDEASGEVYEKTEYNLHVFNQELEEVSCIDLAENLYGMVWNGAEDGLYANLSTMNVVGDEVYFKLYPNKAEMWDDCYVFRCKRSDMIAGTMQFEFAYRDVQ